MLRGEKMTRAGQAVLTERESAYFEHRRQAQALGVGLAEYCRRQRLRVEEWYQIKRDLVRKGMANGRAGAADRSEDRHASFVPVHVTAAATVSQTVTMTSPIACRIQHSSGWTLECANLPPAAWLTAVMAGARR